MVKRVICRRLVEALTDERNPEKIASAIEAENVTKRRRAEQKAMAAYGTAQLIAAHFGMALRFKSPTHYELQSVERGWIVDFFPWGGRVQQVSMNPGPAIDMGTKWTLTDLVVAAIKADLKKGEVE